MGPPGEADRDTGAPDGGSGEPSADEERILAYVRVHGVINNAACRELLGVGLHRAWYLLRCLHLKGLLHQECSGRWARYRLPRSPRGDAPGPGESSRAEAESTRHS